jgi:hypothetical protein
VVEVTYADLHSLRDLLGGYIVVRGGDTILHDDIAHQRGPQVAA